VSEGEQSGKRHQPISTEAVGTLIWLLDTNDLDRRRHSVLYRLRAVRESDQFAQAEPESRARAPDDSLESIALAWRLARLRN
jgi:hypothetical protein